MTYFKSLRIISNMPWICFNIASQIDQAAMPQIKIKTRLEDEKCNVQK